MRSPLDIFDSQTRPQPSRSPRFLKAVQGLVHRASTVSISTSHLDNANGIRDTLSRSGSDSSSSRGSQDSSSQILWKRRGNTPGMNDYLTLSQLEAAWDAQDIYLSFINVPQETTIYTFQEAVEAPVTTKHKIIDRPVEASPPPPPPKDSVPYAQVQDDPIVIDGSLHPALRPQPYLPNDEPRTNRRPSPPRLAIVVPETKWTYGRG